MAKRLHEIVVVAEEAFLSGGSQKSNHATAGGGTRLAPGIYLVLWRAPRGGGRADRRARRHVGPLPSLVAAEMVRKSAANWGLIGTDREAEGEVPATAAARERAYLLTGPPRGIPAQSR